MITVANVNGSPASNPRLGFGSYSDDTNFYFFESEQERINFIATLNIGVPTPAQDEAEEQAFRTILRNLLAPIAGKRYDQITAGEVRLLVALLVHEQYRGIDRTTGVYKPGNQWIR